jgi:type IX secretion system PorP/SprF family membrane protein
MIRLALILVGTCLFTSKLFSQQDPHFTQYFDNYLFLNPAYAGKTGSLNMSALHREQWVGFEGRPRTSVVSMNSPLSYKSVGLGLSAARDVIGPINRTMIYADFSYSLRLTEKSKLSLGMKAGITSNTALISQLQTAQDNDPRFQNNYLNRMNPNFGFGVLYHTPKFFVGASIPRILESSIYGNSTNKEFRHYYFSAGGTIKLTEDWEIRPTGMLKVVMNSPLSVDLSIAGIYNEQFHFGAMYRYNSAFGLFGQFVINKQFKVGIATDFSTTAIRSNSAGTYEILLSYDLISK